MPGFDLTALHFLRPWWLLGAWTFPSLTRVSPEPALAVSRGAARADRRRPKHRRVAAHQLRAGRMAHRSARDAQPWRSLRSEGHRVARQGPDAGEWGAIHRLYLGDAGVSPQPDAQQLGAAGRDRARSVTVAPDRRSCGIRRLSQHDHRESRRPCVCASTRRSRLALRYAFRFPACRRRCSRRRIPVRRRSLRCRASTTTSPARLDCSSGT